MESANGKELCLIDYDGFNFETLTKNQTLNLSPKWMPNGEGIIFMSYLAKYPSLYKLELNSRKVTPLLLAAGMYSAPAISPDGNQLLFTYSQNGNSEIYSSNHKGLLPRRLTIIQLLIRLLAGLPPGGKSLLPPIEPALHKSI